ncbi:PelD GGDEF domain-containing protein [Geobacter sp.]|uniref:PelD GGDEF domain-containing protein n=1 Tax=Geobacter sp. TaxID=46610 RepID=UPI0027BA6364|nr:PelD GGDEF domain-containing protein [Geobacter sp.]
MAFKKDITMKLNRWLETFAITAIVITGGFLLNSSDPLFVHAQFPWVWFGPLLVALRYGIAPGLVSTGGICLTLLVMPRLGLPIGEFPTNYVLGGLLIVLLTGQFSEVWNKRLRHADHLSRHTSDRFEQLSRAYFMVRLSHDRLEQNLISRPVTLRDAMINLRNLLLKHGGRMDSETGAALLSILMHYCSLQSAALYLANDDNEIADHPLAQCGKGATLKKDDLLLRSAIESGQAAYQSINSRIIEGQTSSSPAALSSAVWSVDTSRLDQKEQTSYLVVAPMRTSSGKLLGLLLVTEMPFLNLHRETLQIMGVLLAYASDQAESVERASDLLNHFPDCPPNFAAELIKTVRLKRDLDVSSALVMLKVVTASRLDEISRTMERQQRGLDHSWQRTVQGGAQFVTLMPFSGPASIEGYQSRLDEILRRQFGRSIGQEGITMRSAIVAADDPLVQLVDLLEERQ